MSAKASFLEVKISADMQADMQVGKIMFSLNKDLCYMYMTLIRKKRDCTINVAKPKALISCAGTVQLICAFVFAQKQVFS